ncbi:hypothetical protein DPMN_027716 [Dreissena polymorpha]|uniref:Uncharacterized protein n=1 Tax=Dreissena polymorpha TaxID=45954 RepID=A0A9D4EJS8_DREPO|nr:hypothetical protein DPMN_157623 [Dreissena polymorpha]KAH3864691.1 hypothetical protein DPMN_027716 [Dreissena polymorpha]
MAKTRVGTPRVGVPAVHLDTRTSTTPTIIAMQSQWVRSAEGIVVLTEVGTLTSL